MLFAAALMLTVLASSAFAGEACYLISNFAVPQYVNITLNNTFFQERLNFIGPSSAGVTINDNASYTLLLNQSQTIKNTTNYTFSTTLLNVSWLPVEHSVSLSLCSIPNSLLTPLTVETTATSTLYTTVATSTATTTIPMAPTTTDLQSTASTSKYTGVDYWPALIADAAVVIIVIIMAIGRHKKDKIAKEQQVNDVSKPKKYQKVERP